MRHLVPSTNYEGYNGRVQLNTAAIWSRARLPNQERGINKAGAAGPHADPHQLCLCQYAAMNRMFPAWMQGQEGRWERRGKHVETNKWREDSRQKLDRVTVRTQEMQWGGITNRKEKFYPLWIIIKENAITLWCAASIKQRISLTLLFRHKEKNMHKVPHLSQKYAFKNDECSWNAGFLNIQSEQFMWEQTKKNKTKAPTYNQPKHVDKQAMEKQILLRATERPDRIKVPLITDTLMKSGSQNTKVDAVAEEERR